MRGKGDFITVAIVVGHLLAGGNVPCGDEYYVRTCVGFEQLRLTIALEFRVIQQPAEPARFRRRIDAVRLGLVLKKVHVTSDCLVLSVHFLAFFGQLIADHFARVLANELAAREIACGKHGPALVFKYPNLQPVLFAVFDRLLDVLFAFLVQVGLALARTLANLKVVGDLAIAVALEPA